MWISSPQTSHVSTLSILERLLDVLEGVLRMEDLSLDQDSGLAVKLTRVDGNVPEDDHVVQHEVVHFQPFLPNRRIPTAPRTIP